MRAYVINIMVVLIIFPVISRVNAVSSYHVNSERKHLKAADR